MSKHKTTEQTAAPDLTLTPAEEMRYATIGAAAQVQRIFGLFPDLIDCLSVQVENGTRRLVLQGLTEEPANGNAHPEQPEPHPEQPERQLPHRAPRPPAKHPRGKQRNPATHRSPRGHHAPPKRRTRAPMTSAQRKAVSERMRQYWAQRRMH